MTLQHIWIAKYKRRLKAEPHVVHWALRWPLRWPSNPLDRMNACAPPFENWWSEWMDSRHVSDNVIRHADDDTLITCTECRLRYVEARKYHHL